MRNNRGHYTAASLRAGYRDQYAVHRNVGLIKVELYHDGTNACPWHVALIITNTQVSESNDKAYASLSEARKEYRRLVRRHP